MVLCVHLRIRAVGWAPTGATQHQSGSFNPVLRQFPDQKFSATSGAFSEETRILPCADTGLLLPESSPSPAVWCAGL